jgi:hypothetical protein
MPRVPDTRHSRFCSADDMIQQKTTIRLIQALGAALLAVAYLLPPGDAPWVSFWREWTASLAALLIVLGAVSGLRLGQRALELPLLSLPALALVVAVVPWGQWLCGIEFYRGDAMLVSVYLIGFALCAVVARSMAPEERDALLDRLAVALLVAALCSVPLAVLQWTGQLRLELGMLVKDGRPIAHMEQPNLLCSLLMQGIFGAWRLHERRRLGGRWTLALALVMLLTIDLTQSRIAWVVIAFTVAAWAWRCRSLDMRRRWLPLLGALVIIGAGAFMVPLLDQHLGQDTLGLSDRLAGGQRPRAWALFMDAVREHPWAGWGALQTGAAQFAMADRHAMVGEYFSNAHNLVLDLMVWFGAPIGLLAGGAIVVAIVARLVRAGDAARFVTALALLALLLHALVEMPLHYTYFLFPLALMIGATTGTPASARARVLRIPLRGTAVLAAVALPTALFLALLARDYVPLTDFRPHLTYDDASKHMILDSPPPITDTLMLDQLRAFQLFSMVQPRPGLDAATLAGLREPMLRFPFAPSQEHYARIVALNGEPGAALDALHRSCSFMLPDQCEDSRRAWSVWRSRGEPLPDWP